MKRTLAIILAAMMIISCFACFAGCSEKPAEGGEPAASTIDVGIVLPTKDEPRWTQDETRFNELIGETEFTSEILFSQGDSAKELQNVETLITKGIKVLIICAHDATAAGAAVEAAKAEGITVICYDRLITGTEAVDYYVTFNSVSVGEAQGQYLVDQIAADTTGNSLYLYAGAATDNNAFLFFEGAWNVLQPKIADGTFEIQNSSEAVALKDKAELTRDEMSAIIGQVTTNWDFNEAKNKAEAHLTDPAAKKGDCFILAPNDGTARAIADTFAADTDVTKYFITGQDAENASLKYVLDGKQSMTVWKDTRVLAKDALDMALTVLNGSTPDAAASYDNGAISVPSKETPVTVITADNLEAEIVDSGYTTLDNINSAE